MGTTLSQLQTPNVLPEFSILTKSWNQNTLRNLGKSLHKLSFNYCLSRSEFATLFECDTNVILKPLLGKWFQRLQRTERGKVISGLDFLAAVMLLSEYGNTQERLLSCFELFDFENAGVIDVTVIPFLLKTCLQGIEQVSTGFGNGLAKFRTSRALAQFAPDESRGDLTKDQFIQWAENSSEIIGLLRLMKADVHPTGNQEQETCPVDSKTSPLELKTSPVDSNNSAEARRISNLYDDALLGRLLGCSAEDAVVKRQKAYDEMQFEQHQKVKSENAAVRIQANVRGHAGRIILLKKSSAAKSIQQWTRTIIDRRKRAHLLQSKNQAATKMQSLHRGRTGRKQVSTIKLEQVATKKRNSAILLQAVTRGRIARKQAERISTDTISETSMNSTVLDHDATLEDQNCINPEQMENCLPPSDPSTQPIEHEGDADPTQQGAHAPLEITKLVYDFELSEDDSEESAQNEPVDFNQYLTGIVTRDTEAPTVIVPQAGSESEEECDIEVILEHKYESEESEMHYKIRWSGADPDEDEWFSRTELLEAEGKAPSMVLEYETQHGL